MPAILLYKWNSSLMLYLGHEYMQDLNICLFFTSLYLLVSYHDVLSKHT